MWEISALFLAILQTSLGQNGYIINNKKFPSSFMFGTSTSAYQIEGAWNEDGKGPSIWDNFTHKNPQFIVNKTSGDVACDSYHKYKEDVAIMKYLNLDHYRFSISWSRILPNGLADQVNEKGIWYYRDLIQELKANNIEPLVTLYHWDLPETLQDLGGFLNDDFPAWFANYSRVVFKTFGDHVTYWITFNEPRSACSGYGTTSFAPGVNMPGVGEYFCMHNLIKAHATAYHVYKDELKKTGKIAIAHNVNYCAPQTNTSEDIAASEQYMQFNLGWTANPIINGDYPEVMKTRIANRSTAEGYGKSRLPEFTEQEKTFIKNTQDYFGVNVYVTGYAYAIAEPEIKLPPSVEKDVGVGTEWKKGDETFGMTDLLRWIAGHYDKPSIIITENGLGTDAAASSLQDDNRISKIKNSLSRFKDAIDENINVFGYCLWSLLDNFEWNQGYTQKYGIYQIDFNNPNRTRTPRKSAEWYKKVIKTHCLVENCVD